MIVLGLLLGLTGTDIYTGARRFTFGSQELLDGIDFVAIAVGVFGIGEILRNLETADVKKSIITEVKGLWPSREDFRRMIGPSMRGTMIGSMLGTLPGGGALLSSFAAYNLEKKISKNSAEFGNGAIEGVAAPESANNAGAQTSFIPMLTLGVPSNVTMALMMGAMIIQGIQPGPNVIVRNPELFWGLITSMWVGNAMLVVLNLPLIGIWVKLLRVPYTILFPTIIAFCCIGVYSVNNSSFGGLHRHNSGAGGISPGQARLRTRALRARLYSGADAGGSSPASFDHLGRKSDGVSLQPDQRRSAWSCFRRAGRHQHA